MGSPLVMTDKWLIGFPKYFALVPNGRSHKNSIALKRSYNSLITEPNWQVIIMLATGLQIAARSAAEVTAIHFTPSKDLSSKWLRDLHKRSQYVMVDENYESDEQRLYGGRSEMKLVIIQRNMQQKTDLVCQSSGIPQVR